MNKKTEPIVKQTIKQKKKSKSQRNKAGGLAGPGNSQENKVTADFLFPGGELIQNCCVLLSHLNHEQAKEE